MKLSDINNLIKIVSVKFLRNQDNINLISKKYISNNFSLVIDPMVSCVSTRASESHDLSLWVTIKGHIEVLIYVQHLGIALGFPMYPQVQTVTYHFGAKLKLYSSFFCIWSLISLKWST